MGPILQNIFRLIENSLWIDCYFGILLDSWEWHLIYFRVAFSVTLSSKYAYKMNFCCTSFISKDRSCFKQHATLILCVLGGRKWRNLTRISTILQTDMDTPTNLTRGGGHLHASDRDSFIQIKLFNLNLYLILFCAWAISQSWSN